MADLGNIATTSLIAYQNALSTVANNIANANVEGYSKQRANLTTRQTQFLGGQFVGSGAALGNIQRLTDIYAQAAMYRNGSDQHLHETFFEHATQLDSLFSQEGTDISGNMQLMFGALELANDRPDELAPRINFFEQAQGLVSQFQNLQNLIDQSFFTIGDELDSVASELTSIGQSIAQINQDIAASPGLGDPPDLLDERDRLVLRVSELVEVQTVTLADGSMNVFIGQGETLVAGVTSATVTANINPTSAEVEIFADLGSGAREITQNIRGGELQGLLDFESNILAESNRVLGQMAMGIAINFNQQQNDGMDFNGLIGQDIFTDYNSATLSLNRANADVNNVGTAQLSVAITDMSQIQTSDYRLRITDGAAQTGVLTRLSDGTQTAVDFTAPPVTVDGMTLTVAAGAFAALPDVDEFNIFPTRNASGFMALQTTTPRDLALAAPVRTAEDPTNTGTGEIDLVSITQGTPTLVTVPGANDFGDTYQIRIVGVDRTANTITYDLVNPPPAGPPGVPAGSGIIVDDAVVNIGDNINIAGAPAPEDFYNVRITGLPNVGDIFTIELNNTGGVVGVGDNFNGLQMSDLQNQLLLEGGTESFFDRYSNLIADVGAQTFRAKFRGDSAKVLFDQAETQKLAATGVNLDEEGASLLYLQRSYQASGQLLAASNEVFDILFAAISG